MKKRVLNAPVIRVDWDKLPEGVSREDVGRYLPQYITNPIPLRCGFLKYWWLTIVQTFLIALVKIFLRPRKGKVGTLDQEEVNRVYAREAASYNLKHHLTTRGMDTVWRRLAGWCVVSFAKKCGRSSPVVLDLCTGTGLAIKEIADTLWGWGGMSARITGLDYSDEMLLVAKLRRVDYRESEVKFVRGDATRLVGGSDTDCAKFKPGTVDVVTQVFGIGGISNSLAVFRGVIEVLSPGGRYLMVDMHQPIADQPCEWPFFWRWLRFPIFEYLAYNYHTMPVVLNRLWGWKDPTLDFYFLPLTTWRDDASGKYWGFEVVFLEMESQRWWLGLPLMPIAKIIVEKVEISKTEAEKRSGILTFLNILD